jgi:hypothetical protein
MNTVERQLQTMWNILRCDTRVPEVADDEELDRTGTGMA